MKFYLINFALKIEQVNFVIFLYKFAFTHIFAKIAHVETNFMFPKIEQTWIQI